MHDLATLRAGGYRNAGLTQFKLTGAPELADFPPEIGADLGATLEVLDLSNTRLATLPADLGERLPRLRVAFFSGCRFARFPSALAGCTALEMVAFRRNGMEAIDEDALPPSLRWLILTDNRVERLPASIGRCARLEKCMLAGNRLRELPPQMAQCRNLTLLRLAANQLEGPLPQWLLTLPKLAFLSFAGNPFMANHAAAATSSTASVAPAASASPSSVSSLPFIDWDQIEIHHVLGEGASGVISRGVVRNSSAVPSTAASGQTTPALTSLSGASTPAQSLFSTGSAASSTATSLTPPAPHVAVKVFRGSLTSDGTPYDEMAACLAAGQHVNLVQVHGQIRWGNDDAEGEESEKNAADPAASVFRGGLVMDLIPPEYRVLGQPPSFATCTRDCYDDDARGSVPAATALAILSGVASAAEHLHARGISHGDLYAHNILVRHGPGAKDGDNATAERAAHAILSDFGAATLYGHGAFSAHTEKDDVASLMEKIEVLAFAHLIEDVLGLLADAKATNEADPADTSANTVRSQLLRLHKQCSVPTVADRPAFAALVRELTVIQASL